MRWPLPVRSRWIERRRERERAGHAGAVVDRGRAELDRVHLLGAGHRHDAGCRLDDVVISGLAAARTFLSKGRERGIDQARIDFRQRLVAQPKRVERAGAVVLHEHVGGLDQRFEDFAVALLLEVERHRALVGGLGQELRAHQLVVERLVGARAAALVGVVRVLDLDHVGAEHAELIGRERPRQNVGRVDRPGYPRTVAWRFSFAHLHGVNDSNVRRCPICFPEGDFV